MHVMVSLGCERSVCKLEGKDANCFQVLAAALAYAKAVVVAFDHRHNRALLC